jgi:hypothetical protein
MRLALLVLCACHASDPGVSPPIPTVSPSEPATPVMKQTLAIKLLASPTNLAMADRAKFTVGLEVTNHGTATIDPQLSTYCELTVNGESVDGVESRSATRRANRRGSRCPEAIAMSWPLGKDLFREPGDYHLVMTLGGQQATADVKVTK